MGVDGKARWEFHQVLHWFSLLKKKKLKEEVDKGLGNHKELPHTLLLHLWEVFDDIVVAVDVVEDVLERIDDEVDRIVVSSCKVHFHCFRLQIQYQILQLHLLRCKQGLQISENGSFVCDHDRKSVHGKRRKDLQMCAHDKIGKVLVHCVVWMGFSDVVDIAAGAEKKKKEEWIHNVAVGTENSTVAVDDRTAVVADVGEEGWVNQSEHVSLVQEEGYWCENRVQEQKKQQIVPSHC